MFVKLSGRKLKYMKKFSGEKSRRPLPNRKPSMCMLNVPLIEWIVALNSLI